MYNPPLSGGEHGFWCVFYPPPQMAWVVATTHQNSPPDRGGASPFWVGVFEAWVVALLSRVFEAFPENLLAPPLTGGEQIADFGTNLGAPPLSGGEFELISTSWCVAGW